MMNSMLNSLGLPPNLWGEALLTINHILNRIPFKKTNKSPYEMITTQIVLFHTLNTPGLEHFLRSNKPN